MSQFFASGGRNIGSFRFSISRSNEYLELISFKIDWFDLIAVQETLKNWKLNSLALSLLYGPTLTSICNLLYGMRSPKLQMKFKHKINYFWLNQGKFGKALILLSWRSQKIKHFLALNYGIYKTVALSLVWIDTVSTEEFLSKIRVSWKWGYCHGWK